MKTVILEVHDWHTACGACGYGKGGWQKAWDAIDTPILTPDSTVCHGCGETFTHMLAAYAGARDPEPIRSEDAA